MEKLKKFLAEHEKEYELVRYVIAGGLTTLLSIAVFSLFCIAVSGDHTVDGANETQALIGNGLSWVIAVLFAFWINRRMVFRRKGGESRQILIEMGQFIASRAVSGVLFEIGLMWLLIGPVGLSNLWSKLIVLVLVTVFNYVVSKFWIFAKKPEPTAAPAATAEAPCARAEKR